MIGWNFPLNHDGEEEGFNNSGIETFKGVPYDALAREIIQNSLDARIPGSEKPVHVHFDLEHIDKGLFPGREEYEEILVACKGFKPDTESVQDFFNTAIDTINSETIPVLKIRDLNTTGLLGSQNPSHGHDWKNLIKSSGLSEKGTGKGGSFGIGKNAPFACSTLRTVFYSTKDYLDNEAFQGVTRLMTHLNHNGDDTRGTGYYGTKKKNGPVLEMGILNRFFKREEVGTDIFIVGFKKLGIWKDEIIKSVIENFFVAIHEEKLIVRVQGEQITSSNLPEYLKGKLFEGSDCLAPYYFKALTSPDKYPFVEDNPFDLGKVELHLLPENNFPKRVAIFRDTGMKIWDKGHFQTPVRFAGVFIARGEDINEFMRKIEPPSHNAWEPERYKDPDEARKNVKQIFGWLNEKVRSLAVIDDSEELDVEGVSDFLPDDIEELEPEAFDAEEGISSDQPKAVETTIVSPEPSATVNTLSKATGNEADKEGSVRTDSENPNVGTGADGARPTEPTNDVGDGNGTDLDNSVESGDTPTKISIPIGLNRVRTFCTDSSKGQYKVLFEPIETGVGTLRIVTVGDDGSVESAPIVSAKLSADGTPLTVAASGKVGPLNFVEGVRNAIEVELRDGLRCAMEVYANAN